MRACLITGFGVGWIACGPFLAWFMGKRGHYAVAWFTIGSVIGPAALALALAERLSWTQPGPERVVRGKDNGGSVNVLVLMDEEAAVIGVARPLVEWFGACLGRLAIARVVPMGGPIEEQERTTAAIEEAAALMTPYRAEGLLVFGLVGSAVGKAVRDEGFHVVVTARPSPAVQAALVGTEAVHVDGPQYVPQLNRRGPKSPARRCHGTPSGWTVA